MNGREKDEWAMKDWKMYDVPVTFSILAPHPSAAKAYVAQLLHNFPPKVGSDAYDNDHAFVDGDARECDCMGH